MPDADPRIVEDLNDATVGDLKSVGRHRTSSIGVPDEGVGSIVGSEI